MVKERRMFMLINVDKDNIVIDPEAKVHKGEFNVNELEFTFTNEFDGLVKIALFYGNDNIVYRETILNNKCKIPYEVLTHKTRLVFGVYGYEADADTHELVLRYSPSPTFLEVHSGSFIENATDGTVLVPALTLEEYEQAIQEALIHFDIEKERLVREAQAEFQVYFEGKETEFDLYYNGKESTFDSHVTDKIGEFNTNATNKTTEFNGVVDEAETEIARHGDGLDILNIRCRRRNRRTIYV